MIGACEEFGLEVTTVALSGGEDYELLFTISQEDFEKVQGNPDLTIIGHMADAATGRRLITRSGESLELTARGWNAFGS